MSELKKSLRDRYGKGIWRKARVAQNCSGQCVKHIMPGDTYWDSQAIIPNAHKRRAHFCLGCATEKGNIATA